MMALPGVGGGGAVGAQNHLPRYLTSGWWNLALEAGQIQKSTSKAKEILDWLQKGLQGI